VKALSYIAIIAAGDEKNRNVVMYLRREHQQMNLAYAISDLSLKSAARLEYSWNAMGSVEEMIKGIRGIPDWLQRVFRSVRSIFQLR
jgi:salicylate hydroxylase